MYKLYVWLPFMKIYLQKIKRLMSLTPVSVLSWTSCFCTVVIILRLVCSPQNEYTCPRPLPGAWIGDIPTIHWRDCFVPQNNPPAEDLCLPAFHQSHQALFSWYHSCFQCFFNGLWWIFFSQTLQTDIWETVGTDASDAYFTKTLLDASLCSLMRLDTCVRFIWEAFGGTYQWKLSSLWRITQRHLTFVWTYT